SQETRNQRRHLSHLIITPDRNSLGVVVGFPKILLDARRLCFQYWPHHSYFGIILGQQLPAVWTPWPIVRTDKFPDRAAENNARYIKPVEHPTTHHARLGAAVEGGELQFGCISGVYSIQDCHHFRVVHPVATPAHHVLGLAKDGALTRDN